MQSAYVALSLGLSFPWQPFDPIELLAEFQRLLRRTDAFLSRLLARTTRHLAGAADIGKLVRKVQQRQLAMCYLILRSHVRCRRILGATPHVAQNTVGRRSAIDGSTARHPGYVASIRVRKRIEKVRFAFTFAAAYNRVRLPKLLAA